MHYIYGDEVWGIPGEEVFRLNLAQTDAIVHNMNSNIYGFIDNDDVFQYVGGLASAYRYITGSGSPEVYVTDNRDPDENPTVSSLSVVIHRELRTRYLNPKWIEGMRGEGYAGTREISNFMEHLWGWDATMPDLITESMWQQVYEAYKGDDYTPTTADAVIALRMATGSIPALDWADVSGDGTVTSLDALMILQNTIGG
jgi:cobaltochelatase CobN